MKQDYIKSPLNYVGGKFKALSQIIPLLPQNIDTFIDLFGGGFNVGVNVESRQVIYNDLCLPLVQIMEYMGKWEVGILLTEIDAYIADYELSKENEMGYKGIREDYNALPVKPPMMLYTLICYAFNNQIRFNSKGEFNMPFGKNRSSFNPTLRQKFISFADELFL